MFSITDVVKHYKRFLTVNHPIHVKLYCSRLNNQSEGARAEAVAFHFFKTNLSNVCVEEHETKGGVDFLCQANSVEFVAEVTCLDVDAVTRESGLPNAIPENISVRSYRKITHLLRTKTSNKAKQMSEYNCPRILIIACEHKRANALLDTAGTEWLLTSDTQIPIATSGTDFNLVTYLDNSAFFREENGKLESCRRSISAILLFCISDISVSVVGTLHPDPVHNFPIELLPSVPFVRLKKWPVENDSLSTEWVTHKQTPNTTTEQVLDEPRPMLFYYDEKFR